MRIQNNIMAMNTHRMYSSNNAAVSRSAEKLSSGYRINRAGDDAAGLAISEKMRAQVRGLNMAAKNSQDAISLVQTSEGALQEVHSMLQRMNELSVQSATGTNADFDRTQISAEFDQLKGEIDQIADTTNFNNMKLLDGSLAQTARTSFNATSKTATIDFTFANLTEGAGITVSDGTNTINFRVNLTDDAATPFKADAQNVEVTGLSKSSTKEAINNEFFAKINAAFGASGTTAFTVTQTKNATTGENSITLVTGATDPTATTVSMFEGGLKIQVGAEEGNQLNVAIDSMSSKSLGLEGVSISSQANAGNAITKTRDAINRVSEQRAAMGAMQNRMEHKISNLDNTAENLQAAESRIRDVDIAKEMTSYTKNNILSQAATAMLAQANAAPQSVLNLLR